MRNPAELLNAQSHMINDIDSRQGSTYKPPETEQNLQRNSLWRAVKREIENDPISSQSRKYDTHELAIHQDSVNKLWCPSF